MAILIDSNSEWPQINSILDILSFTAMGWSYIVSDLGSPAVQNICDCSSSVPTDADAYIAWEAFGGENMYLSSYNLTDGEAPVAFASRPAIGTWWHWYIQCSGSGANQLVGGWRPWNSSVYVTATNTLMPNSATAGTVALLLGSNGATFYANSIFAGFKLYNTPLNEIDILSESFYYVPVYWSNLTMCVPFLGNSLANCMLDISPNGNNFTQNGSMSIVDGPPIMWSKRRAKSPYNVPTPGAIAWWRA